MIVEVQYRGTRIMSGFFNLMRIRKPLTRAYTITGTKPFTPQELLISTAIYHRQTRKYALDGANLRPQVIRCMVL